MRTTLLSLTILLTALIAHADDQPAFLAPPKQSKDEVEAAVKALAARFTDDTTYEQAFVNLAAYLANSPAFGTAYAYTPRPGTPKASPYVFRNKARQLEGKDLAKSYDYLTWDWYTQPVKAQKGIWTAPYFDEGGGDVWMVTYSLPVYQGKTLLGVLTTDLELKPQ